MALKSQVVRSFIVMAVASLGISGMGKPAHALVVTPARTEVRLLPGTTAEATLSVTNDDKVVVQVTVSKKDWFIPPANQVWTVDRWLNVHGDSVFVLEPGKSQTIPLSIFCPQDVVGEVVGMVSFTYRGEEPSMVTPMISVSVYVIAAGRDLTDGAISDILVRDYQGQVNVSTKVRATGNVHLRPGGRFVVTNSKGREVAVMPVPSGAPTYPGTEAVYSGTTPAETKLKAGRYKVLADLSYERLHMTAVREFTIGKDGKVQMGLFK